MVKLIWAMTENGIIGLDNSLPWKIKSEMQYFQTTTINQNVLMGSKTFESIGYPLKKRYNVVITTNPKRYLHWDNNENIIFTNNLDENLLPFYGNEKEDIYVLGGKTIYEQSWKFADYLYISIIKYPYQGNVLFSNFDFSNFILIKSINYEEFIAKIYKRKDLN